jgi:hypothetical protein
MAPESNIKMRPCEEDNLMDNLDINSDDEYETKLYSLESTKSSLENVRASLYAEEDGEKARTTATETTNDFIAHIITADDDPTLNPWTFRTWFVG